MLTFAFKYAVIDSTDRRGCPARKVSLDYLRVVSAGCPFGRILSAMNRSRRSRRLRFFGSPQASPAFCCLVGLMLFAAPVALVAPVRGTEVNNTLPAEEETKSSSSEGVTHSQVRHRSRHSIASFTPVLRTTSNTSSSFARTCAPQGTSEHAHREGLGTPLRC